MPEIENLPRVTPCCNRCHTTRDQWLKWRGFAVVPGADVICCVDPDMSPRVSDW